MKKFCRGPWCDLGRRTYKGKPFDREKLIEKAAALQPFILRICDEANRDHAAAVRQYAHVGPHGDDVICVAEAFLDLGRDYRDGLLAHEIGHLVADPDPTEEGADAAFETLTGITIRYKDSGDGECLQWLRPEDSKKLEGIFKFDLSQLKPKAKNPVEEGETEAGRRQRLEVERHAILKATHDLIEFTRDAEWGHEIADRLYTALESARRQTSYRVGQKAVDRILLEVVRRAQRVREKNRDLGERVERFLRLSQTPRGRAAIQAEIEAQLAAEEAAREITVETPRFDRTLMRVVSVAPRVIGLEIEGYGDEGGDGSDVVMVSPQRLGINFRVSEGAMLVGEATLGLPSDRIQFRSVGLLPEAGHDILSAFGIDREKTREEAVHEIEGLMEPLMKAEQQLEIALSRLKRGWPGYHKRVEEAQALAQDLRARYEAARKKRDKASNPRRR